MVRSSILPPYLEIRETPERGRGIFYVGTEPCPPGTLLFESAPFAACLQYQHWTTLCHYCFQKPTTSLKRCARCRLVYYCSRSCQEQSWNEYHYVEGVAGDDITDLLLLGRTLRRLAGKVRSIRQPPEHLIEAPVSLLKSMCLTRTLLKDPIVFDILSKSGLTADEDPSQKQQIFYTWLLAFQCNNFMISDPLLSPVAAGVYPVSSLMNHSCVPNCVLTYDLTTLGQSCRALCAIEPGTELCHLYVEAALPTVERQLTLEATYGFVCACSRCSQQSPTSVERPLRQDRWGNTLPGLQALGSVPCETRHQDTLSNIRTVLESVPHQSTPEQQFQAQESAVLQLEAILHPLNLDLYAQRSELFSLALNINNLRRAAQLGNQLVSFLEHVYSDIPFHPMLGIQLHTLGDIYAELGDKEKAISHLQRAKKILIISSGINSPLIRNIHSRLTSLLCDGVNEQTSVREL